MSLSGAEVLANVPLFGGLPAEELQRLASLLRPHQYARGEMLFLAGDQGTSLCLIAAGRIRIQLTGPDGREVTINVYGPGEIVGEMALLDGEPRSADAIAQDPTHVYWLHRDDFVTFLQRYPHAAMTMMAGLSRRLRHTTRVVENTTLRDVPARLAQVILELAELHGRQMPEGICIDLRLTQSDLAARIGASRETVNRVIRSFEAQGLLRWSSVGTMLLRVDRLRDVATDG